MAEDESQRDEVKDTCSACGSPLGGTGDRSYGFAEQGALCFQCAIERGGEYDADADRWTAAPRVGDLARTWRPRG